MDVNGNTDKPCLIRGLRQTESVSSSLIHPRMFSECALRSEPLSWREHDTGAGQRHWL